MSEEQSRLFPMYKGWDTYQELLIKALGPLLPEQLTLRPAAQLRSIGENATHMVAVRAGWLYYVLGRGDVQMETLASWGQEGQPARQVSELIEGFEATWRVIQDTLNEWTIADMAELVEDIDEHGEKQTYTRQWVLWHLIEHDVHHGGEVSFTLGMHGLPGVMI